MTVDDRSQSDLYTELALPYSWASLLLDDHDGDTPTLLVHCEPLEVSQPVTRDELRALSEGAVPEALAARIAGLGSPPGRPLGEADWGRLRTLAAAGLLALDAAATRAGAAGRGDIPTPRPPDGEGGRSPSDAGEAAGRPVEVIDLNDPDGQDELDRETAGGGDAGETAPADIGAAADTGPDGKVSGPVSAGQHDQADLDFKVIARFARRENGARELVISVGGSERSEHYHITEVDDWRDGLLDELVPVVESFQARCVERPVNPAYRPAPPPRTSGQKNARAEGDRAKGKAREGTRAGAGKATPQAVFPAAAEGQTPPVAAEPAPMMREEPPVPAKPEQFRLLFG